MSLVKNRVMSLQAPVHQKTTVSLELMPIDMLTLCSSKIDQIFNRDNRIALSEGQLQ